jgi:hypothetical protein
MSTWRALAGLELDIEDVRLERREAAVSSDFVRVTTTVVLAGRGVEGRGEDVNYQAEAHDWFPDVPARGRMTLSSYSESLDGLPLFPEESPAPGAAVDYRRWALESAGLDLALRQGGTSLGEALGREYGLVRFVVSTRLDPRAWLAFDPQLEFKLDPTSDWDRSFMEAIASTGRVRCLDLKAYYVGTPVDQAPDPALYRTVRELFPDAVIEDAALTPETLEALHGAESRLSFDAPIHSLADIDALPLAVRWLNVKPSRFGSLERLFECIDACDERGVRMYGGGQFELGCGRGQIQALASLFYADGPNDVAPSVYNESEPRPGLPSSPLHPPQDVAGFSFAAA